INGVITFMLTPGSYYESGNFWAAFFNPTYFPSLFFRTVICIVFAGVFAMFTAAFQFDERVREKAILNASFYLAPCLFLMPVFAGWYFWMLPGLSKDIVMGGSALLMIMANICAGSAALLIIAAVAHAWIDIKRFSAIFTIILIIFAGTFMATFELVREGVRKPYTLYERLYSNSIYVDGHGKPEMDASGFLKNLKWCPVKEVTPANKIEAGREIFRYQCQACHAIDGYNAVRPLVKYWSEDLIKQNLMKMNELKKFMPPFFGSGLERDALAAYLYRLNHAAEVMQSNVIK
ncbi:MAG TPA: cytochrome c, partial [Candidatus Wallbacteria bacterium]|nr:cytochrome c [Candidatus Wallbacteria bacterium]